MKEKTIRYLVTALLLMAPHDLFAETPAATSTRHLRYRQDNGPAYRVTQTREEDRLTILYQYGKEIPDSSAAGFRRGSPPNSPQNGESLNRGLHQAPDVRCVRNLKTGRLESCETFFHKGSRRYEFAGKEVKVTLPGGRLSTHRVTTVAHPQLLDAICAFVASGRDSQEVLYISQAESFGTQGFVMTREGRERVTTPAGTFECFKVKLTLDSRIGALFFRLDFLVAGDGHYPYIVKGHTSSGGEFQLVGID